MCFPERKLIERQGLFHSLSKTINTTKFKSLRTETSFLREIVAYFLRVVQMQIEFHQTFLE